ncbi:MBOAT family O-acyltransferase [Azohydromonas australica]|uniref:MBOAT family O-acyltransferase n=1 Tax=Azohydromonas australica TaxID=364039 RepID=UPI00040B7887|nr:MBOAT family protein [Azohydromonas australica]
MLFTTATFVLLFLPAALAGFFVLGRRSQRAAAAWLFGVSLFFYGWWMPKFTLLLLASIGINFSLGLRIARVVDAQGQGAARRWLALGVAFNLLLLGYFKYANFFLDNVNALAGTHWTLAGVVLPIGISFYSFTQIAFLVDTWHGKVREFQLVHYGLFVTYFPHLVAGPVLHHAQMMPQFARATTYRFDGANFSAGLAIFAIGLFKKVVLADGIAPYADAVFNPADAGAVPGTHEAWIAALAYTLQLYFDFSGYSDMAIGLSWMFNIRLPYNFNSPYQATNISDFWRRWHISLSTFLRDYLYIALGGNRHGALRRYVNLAATMVLGGLWHGASWAFVLWGALHGAYLMVNHGFRALCGEALSRRLQGNRAFMLASWALTMLCVVVAWVFFRAATLDGALAMLRAMAGAGDASALQALLWNAGLQPSTGALWCLALGALAVLAPNSNRIGERLLDNARRYPATHVGAGSFVACAALMLVLLNTARDAVSAFIYFNF